MTLLLSWNIQYGKGCDGRIDLGRIAAVARSRGPVDVLCFQEVAQNYAQMGGGEDVDQVAELCAHFPGYEPHFAAGVDAPGPAAGPRRRFGNLTLSRLPVLDAAAHLLPRPAEPGVLHMPRAAMACLVETSAGPVRVVSTHLEFHSERQRLAQAERLCALHAEAVENERHPPAPGPGAYALLPRSAGTLVCGDFNFELASPPYAAMLSAFADAWPLVHGKRPHDPTCGIFDHQQWRQGAHARDFWFVSPELRGAVTGIAVDTTTDASDHQPVWLTLSPAGAPRAA